MTQQEYEQKKCECWEEFKREVQCLPVSRHDVFCAAFDRAYALGKETKTITQEEIEKAAKKYAAEVDKNIRDLYGNIPAAITYGECAVESFREGVKFTLGKQEKDADKEEMFTCEKSKVLYHFRMAEACKIGNNPEADYWIGYSKAIQDLFGLEGEPYVTPNDAENTPISERLAPEEKSQLEGIYYYLKRAADKQENESVSVAVLFEVMERLEDIFGIDLLTNGHGKLAPKDADTVIQGWVCRDENGRLCLYQNEPKREAYDFQPRGYWTDKTDQYIDFPPNLFPDLTWESEPQEVEITIKRKKNE